MGVKTPVALADLVGKWKLDAVDFATEQVARWSDEMEDCQVCRFRLNGTVYIAIEDPNDGYRSSMRELVTRKRVKMLNTFPRIEVLGCYVNRRQYGEADILELRDTTNGKVVLEVGTDQSDDYYPSFVASFHPENMAINSRAFHE